MTSAALLKSWRSRRGITQAVAAEILDVPLRTYQNWEAGRTFPYPKILQFALSASEHIAVPVVKP